MDRRVKKTKQIIKDALSKLILKKPYNAISITELCEFANINRGTFYLHYDSVITAIKEFENEILNYLIALIIKHQKDSFDYQAMMIEMANYIKTEKDFIKSILSNNGDINFANNVKEEMHKVFMYEGNNVIRNNDSGYFGYAFATFVITGGIGVFEDWVNNNCKDAICDLILPFEIGFLRLRNFKKN